MKLFMKILTNLYQNFCPSTKNTFYFHIQFTMNNERKGCCGSACCVLKLMFALSCPCQLNILHFYIMWSTLSNSPCSEVEFSFPSFATFVMMLKMIKLHLICKSRMQNHAESCRMNHYPPYGTKIISRKKWSIKNIANWISDLKKGRILNIY